MNYIVPQKMHAWTIRTERLGSMNAFQDEIVEVPQPSEDEVIVKIMAAGVNYNGIWAALGKPKNVIAQNGDFGDEKKDFMICGSEASGIVYKVGKKVSAFVPGDEVCLGGSAYNDDCVKEGMDPCFSPTFHIWGYEGNWGGFAEFAKVKENQCFRKPKHMDWLQAACCGAAGVTAYRMLTGWKPNDVKKGDTVLVWGGAGGIGSMSIKIAHALGANAVAVVSDNEKGRFCMSIGAKGYINRSSYSHWGEISGLSERAYRKWLASAVRFRNEIFSITGNTELPSIVVEHPGGDTLPTSLFVCGTGGMVVLCGATSSFMSDIDLRFLWLNQKRIQGSHAGNADDARGFLELSERAGIVPEIDRVFEWEQLPKAHESMMNGSICGKYVVKVGFNK